MSSNRSWLNLGLTSRIGKITLAFLFLFFSATCFSSTTGGGACPAGVPVTGNNCFFVAANGSDTNSGISESAPWQHAPGMPNCASVCASITPAPGQGFILRGGDTWHFGNNSATPYTGGTWTLTWNGSSGNPIYLGVDQTWFSGGSWTRPILTGDNPTSTSTTLTSCPYASIGSANIMIQLSGQKFITIDNFEMLGLCESAPNDAQQDTYIRYGYAIGPVFTNLYIHGWTHVQFNCSGTTGLCFNTFAFQGGAGGMGLPSDTISNVVVDGSDSDPGGAGVCYCDFWNVSDSVFRYVSQIVDRLPHVYHDNLQEYWYEPGDNSAHGNLWESVGDAPGTNAFYNNIFRHVCSIQGSCPHGIVGIWPAIPLGNTDYFFNNLCYDCNTAGNYLDIGQNDRNQGTFVFFNNTFEIPTVTNPIVQCAAKGYSSPFVAANNHYILEGSSPYSSSSTCKAEGGTFVTELAMNHATATSDGYTNAETYANSPTSSGDPTVLAGTNQQSYCTALSNAGLSDAAKTCQSDTSYSCTYNSSNHTVSCPARTVDARPGSGNWDIGAYEYGNSLPPPNPPTGLTATVQ